MQGRKIGSLYRYWAIPGQSHSVALQSAEGSGGGLFSGFVFFLQINKLYLFYLANKKK